MPLQQYLYRVLADKEDPKNGLVARDPTAKITAMQHVLGKRQSQFISTTATLEGAEMSASLDERRYPRQKIRMVKIDVEELKKEKDIKIIDLTDPEILKQHFPKKAQMARNWAIKYQEVLVEGKIPALCVVLMETYKESSGFDLSDYSETEEVVSLLVDEVSELKSK